MYILDGQATPQTGCELRLAGLSNASVTSNGEERSVEWDADGKAYPSGPEPADREPVRPGRLALYTSSRTVNGVPLRCSVDDICIVDPKVALAAQGSRPVQAASRIDDARTHVRAGEGRLRSALLGASLALLLALVPWSDEPLSTRPKINVNFGKQNWMRCKAASAPQCEHCKREPTQQRAGSGS